jgi:hypothetical protein
VVCSDGDGACAAASIARAQVSRDMAQAFKDDAAAQAAMPAGVDANVRILTSGFWPSYAIMHANLPPEIVQCAPASFLLCKVE